MILVVVLTWLATPDILFSDDFNDGNADGWFEYPGIMYEVIDGEYCFWGGSAGDMGASFSGDLFGFMSVPDYSFRAQVTLETGQMTGQMVRFSYTASYIYVLCIGPDIGGLALVKADEYTFNVLDLFPMVIEYNQPYWMRFEIEGDMLGGRIWTGTPEDEPLVWMVTASDGSVSIPGSIAFFGIALDSDGLVPLSCMFDDVEVSDDLSLDLAPGTWASIKSSF